MLKSQHPTPRKLRLRALWVQMDKRLLSWTPVIMFCSQDNVFLQPKGRNRFHQCSVRICDYWCFHVFLKKDCWREKFWSQSSKSYIYKGCKALSEKLYEERDWYGRSTPFLKWLKHSCATDTLRSKIRVTHFLEIKPLSINQASF